MSQALSRRLDPTVAATGSVSVLVALVLGFAAGIDPLFAIAGALGLGFVLVAFANLTAGLVVFMVAIFMEAVVTSGSVLSFPKIGGLLLAVAWLIRASTDQRMAARTFLARHPTATFAIGAFMAWAAVSLVWAESTGDGFTSLYRYALNIALMLIVFSAVQTRRQATWILGGFVVGSAIAALYGLLVPPASDAEVAFREQGASGSPNDYAGLLITGVAFAIAAAIAIKRSPGLRFALVSVAIVCLAASFLTASRSGLIALAAAMVVAILIGARARLALSLLSALIVVGAITFFVSFAPDEVRERVAETVPGQVSSDEGRFTIWDIAYRVIEDNALVGVGVGNFQTVSADYVLEPGLLTRTDEIIDEPKVAHSIFLHVLAELGVVGAILFFGVVAFSVGAALRAASRFEAVGDQLMEGMARAAIVGLAAMLALFLFHSGQFSKLFWLLLALGPSLLAIAPEAYSQRYTR